MWFVCLRLESVQTEEELSDVYVHFMLYYGRDLVAMKNKKVADMQAKKMDKQQLGEQEDNNDEGLSVKQSHKLVFMHCK